VIATAALTKVKRKAARLVRESSLDFFQLARHLSELHDNGRTALKDMEKSSGLPRRRMYYLVEVGDLIRRYDISKTRADDLGWTKLQIIARHLKKSEQPPSLDELLELASATRAHDLATLLKGRKGAATKAVQFNLNANMRAELDKALLAHGAKRTRVGLTKRESALIRVVRAAMNKAQE